MIDVENEVFDRIAKTLRSDFPGIAVKSTLDLSPSVFPCACVEQINNLAYRKTRDTGSNENHADVTFEVNVYSNAHNAKSECKAIIAVVDDQFDRMGFTRTSCIPVKMDDGTKYRLRAAYRAVISKNHTVYRR